MPKNIKLYEDVPLYAQICIWTIIILLISTTALTAGGLSSARSVAMGGAYLGLASGIDAARHNPANLGLTGYRHTSVEIAGVGANISNNSFTLDDYNTYSGAFLTADDKTYILSKIPEEGLKFSADAEVSALSISSGPFAFAVTGVGAVDVNLNKEIIDLILNGNIVADTISVTSTYSDAVAYATAGVTYGRPVMKIAGKELAVGATFKYVRGIAIERVVELSGMATTNILGFSGSGSMIAQTASGGKGYSIDIGAAIKLSENYTAGIAVENFLSSITWSKNPEEHGYLFNFDSLTLDNASDTTLVTSEDYTIPISSFSTSIPSVMTIGVARTKGSLLWAVDYEQGFRSKAAGASTKPRLSAGAEYKPIGFLPLRAGYSIGGERGATFSLGTGLNFSPFYLDFATVVGSKLSSSSVKGMRLALSMGLSF